MSTLRRTGVLLFVGILVFGILPGIAAAQIDTPGEEATNNLFLLVLVPAIAIGVLVQVLLVVAIVKFRRREGHTTPPSNPKTHDPTLEAVWTIAPAIILLFVGLATFQALGVTDVIPENPDVVVTVRGFQWFWEFTVDEGGNTTTTTGEFTVKVGQTVKLVVVSDNVAHSFWILDFGFKLDAIPGHENVGWFQALNPGDFLIRCAEFCGVGHPAMVATIHVLPA